MTLDYTTAKALKDAGFPQDDRFRAPDCECDSGYVHSDAYFKEKKYDEFAYSPTLSELIQELGDRFHALEQKVFQGMEVDGGKWIAYSNETNDLGIEAHIFKQGETPELACANLYLSIHKK